MRSTHWLILLTIFGILCLPACSATGGPDPEPDWKCTDIQPHPVGKSIAEQFDVPYAQVMTWFCSGHEFEDILLALQTSELSGEKVESLLARAARLGWERVWEDLDLTEGLKP
jgi:hypothetical protein